MYHMNQKQELNALVKECLTIALLELMKTKRIDEISITELIAKAGVSRNSFYRNFNGKRDVLEKRLEVLIREWGKSFEEKGDPNDLSDSLLRHYYRHRDFYLLLYRQGLSDMIHETVRKACRVDDSQTNVERYFKSMFAGMIWGWIGEWMRQGMPESPEEIGLLASRLHAYEKKT